MPKPIPTSQLIGRHTRSCEIGAKEGKEGRGVARAGEGMVASAEYGQRERSAAKTPPQGKRRRYEWRYDFAKGQKIAG